MRNKIVKLIFLTVLAVFVFLPIVSYAGPLTDPDDIIRSMDDAGRKSGFSVGAQDQLPTMIATVIKAVLGLLGIIFIVLLVLAGFNWMTAAGDEEKVTKAKNTITRAVIGLIIIIAAYAITVFVFKNLPGGGGVQPKSPVINTN